MSTLLRRIRKLEFRLTDKSGLIPHTRPWFDFWMGQLERLMDGEPPELVGPIPLAAWDDMVQGRWDSEPETTPSADEI